MKFESLKQLGTALLGAAALAVAGVSSAAAFDVEGKRIEFLVPFGEGGGTDTYARFMAPQLQKFLPGDPSIIVRNKPGAGSIAGANEFEARSEGDGLHLLVVSTSTVLNYVMEDPRVEYDVSKWKQILVSPLGQAVYGGTSLGLDGKIETLDDIKKLQGQTLVMGANGPTSADLPHMVIMDMFGFTLKPVFGLNRGKSRIAFERGEFNLNYDSMAAYREDGLPLIEAGKAVPLFSPGFYIDETGMIEKDPAVPELLTPPEILAMIGKKPEGKQWDAWFSLYNVSVLMSKALVLPADTPDEIVDWYADKAKKMVADPEFIKAADAQTGGYPQYTGAQAKKVVANATSMDAETKAWLFDWLDKTHGYKR